MSVVAQLSTHAQRWLESLNVKRQRPPFEADAIRRWLGPASRDWEHALVAFEARFGGLGGGGFYLGLDGAIEGTPCGSLGNFATRFVLGGPHIAIGGSEWLVWHLDATGRVVEVDDHGHTFYIADSVEKRLEQTAIFEVAANQHTVCTDGLRGAALAPALGLESLAAPSDSRQRFWATPGFTATTEDAILVRESREPIDYGAAELHDVTWLSAGTRDGEAALKRALASLPPAP